MHDHLAAVSLTLLAYAAIALSYFGWGSVAARVLRLTASNGVMRVWLGWAVALLIFQALHLFVPLNTVVIAPVFLGGIALAIPRAVLRARGLRLKRGRMMCVASLAMVIAVVAAWLASRSMIVPRIYDTGLYHLHAIRWINSFPIVPGLGNLHGRLAFNQAFFTYAASLNVAPLLTNGSRIANSFLFLLTAATFLARMRPAATRPALLLESHPFEYLSSLFALPILGYLALSPALTAPTPDLATDLLQLVMFVTLTGVAHHWDGQDSADKTAMLAILAATAITIKLSNLAFSLVVMAIAFFLARRMGNVLRVGVLLTIVLSVWIARGYVSSGMPLYPSTIGSAAFDWSVPRDEAVHMTALIRGWARDPRRNSPALEHWTWLSAWSRRLPGTTVIAPLLLGVCLLGATGVFATLKKPRPRRIEAVIVLPVLAGLAFWFFTAPDPRFAHALFLCFVIAAALLFLTAIQPRVSRRTFALILCAVFAATHLGLALQAYRERETIGQISVAGWQPIPRAPLIPGTTASGLVILTPASERCWDAPLPCTPYFRGDLRLRVPGHLESGFAVTPQSSVGRNTILNLRNFGAAGDGTSDDGPALQRALDALATSGGGALYVPPGSYAIATAVSKNFSSATSSITIAGESSSTAIDVAGNGAGLNLASEFIIKVGKTNIALALSGLDILSIRDVAFVGIKDVDDDAQVVLLVKDIERVNVEHCEFYGLASLGPGGSIVAAHESGLKIDRTAFLGCATSSAHSTSIIRNQTWRDIAVTNTKFVDYGNRPNFYSKTPMAPPYSWISIGDAAASHADWFRRDAVIRNVFLDEGAFIGITARPDLHAPSSAPFNVFISAVRMNVSNLFTCGIYLSGVDKVLIEKSQFGWSHNADAAIILKDVNEAILDRLECVAHANTIRADGATERLVIVNSIYEILDSAAPYTKKVTTPDGPVQFVRQRYLEVLGTEPELHALHFWADQMLRCESDASCLVERRTALAKYLEFAHEAVAWRRRD
ncbi:MAG: hypothetical protein JJE51_02490 [Thermoanaerobaculia bacterium]|nr:hypothetical protein [Thermoanaerobaculia bacterium]